MLRKGEWVWLDSDIGVPIGARVKETPGGRSLVDDDGKEHRLHQEQEASLKIMHPTSVEGVDDMIKLGDMTEAGLLRNLMLRHKQGIIYTYTSSVLVAVNPYQDFPLYTAEQVRLYRGRKLGELPPHIFAIAENCHFNMMRHLRNQCCIISGESGAGKTESTKLILQYLAAVSGELCEQQIEQQILESNPILEAFGNAKTIRNDNSSRFGKYLEIFFNKDGVINGARVEQYLLEKSRVCHQAPEERSYHIFYCLLAGIPQEEKTTLSLGHAKDYRFLTQGNCTMCEGRDDAKDYSRICSAMKILNFSHNHCQEISKLLAAILHLGNVYFEANTENNLETSDVGKSKHFSIAASLLQVQKSSLAKTLTHRSFMTNRERVTKPLNSEQASGCRDAFVKAIYNKLFIWITGMINSVIYKNLANNPKSKCLSIGLLDIFGFENFDTNSFEQLCINFANEKLQQFFVGHIFKLEQKEYAKDDIVWNNISFSDNQEILDLLAGNPCNLLALIDEESNFPKGTDSTMLSKMNKEHKGNKVYIASKNEYGTCFGVNHFAGMVCYDTRGFLEKNRDAVSFDIIKMVDMSSNNLLHQIFQSELSTNKAKNITNKRIIMTPRNSIRAQAGNGNHKHVPTLSGQFRQSLDSLMKALSVCQPYFIRCFKPNNGKLSEVFDRELCMRQLRYSGMMDTIRIRKLGYPIRHTFQEFLCRYRVLLKTRVCDSKMVTAAACCEAICKAVIEGEDEWKRGRTKIFLKDAHDAVLERERETELNRVAVVIQRVMLGHKDRTSFLKKRRAAVVLQRHWRAYMDGAVRRKHGYERLVAKIRSRKLQLQYQRQRAAAVTIQTKVRGYWARKEKRKPEQETMMKPSTKGFLARKTTENALDLEKDNQKQIAIELQQRLEVLDESLQAHEDSESATEQDSEDTYGLRAAAAEEEMSPSMPGPRDHDSDSESENMARASTFKSSTSSLEEDDDDSDEFSFYRFSFQHFQGKATHTHITDRLSQPLLPHDDEGDVLASLTVWWIIMRFMGDKPEPKALDTVSEVSFPQNVSGHPRKLSLLVGLDHKILRRKKRFGNRNASVIPEEPEDLTEDEQILIGEGPTLDRPLSDLEKLRFIVGKGLSRPGIRDEIYCQICKQLVNNRSRNSSMQGWILLSICLGIFAPTEIFLPYLKSFLRRGLSGYKVYCTERLQRTIANGERKERPCWIELQAAKSIEPIHKSVTLMDGRTVNVELESASTSAEVCKDVAAKIGLKDTYGFSLYISFQDKTWSLGSCGKHVLDAVSNCEQEMRRQGMEEKDTPWSLSIAKELFTPWHECATDPVSTDLIYKQVIKKVKSEEYISGKEDEYVQLAMKHYYIQFGSVFNRENAQKVVEECITTTLIENKSMKTWIQLISPEHSQSPYVSGIHSTDRVKGELVDSARHEWRVHFSQFYEVTMMAGPPLPKSMFFVAVNWSSILFMDGKDKPILEIPYLEVKGVSLISDSPFSIQSVSLATVSGEYVLKSTEALDMFELIKTNLDGLRERSTFALALQDVNQSDDPMFLACKRGDLLLVDKHYKYSSEENLVKATNPENSSDGAVYKYVLQFLPTLTMPNDEELVRFRPGNRPSGAQSALPEGGTPVAPVSLREFADEHFRPATKDTGRHGVSKGVNREKLWACTKEPLKQPLLNSLVRNSELSSLACNAFIAILKYMGDYPIKQVRSPVELTDQIFGPATQHEALQDEIYCQIMRQMTSNNNRMSVDRGWQLMWLCTGLFAPSYNLMKHTQRWLESRPKDLLARGCLQRLQQMCSMESRKLPPHLVEVEAIQQNSAKIFHKVHFPNDSSDIFEVTSTTTIKDLRCSIASELRLTSADGYGLYLKTPTKVTSMDEEKYFFDSLRQKAELTKKKRPVKDGNQAYIPFLVLYKRKLWFNVSPGKDERADLIFHFPQEMPKYLRGYHNCTKEDMFTLGGLLFRVKVDSDRSQFVMIPRMLKELVPGDQLKTLSPDEWKKHIIAAYSQQSGITVQEAKIAFLKTICSWPTFGCSFFDVKQTCEPSYPNRILIAISKQGVSLIDPTTKELVVMHPFSRINEYYSKGNSFQMSIGSLVRGNNFVCETPQAHTMEDLLKSYIAMYGGIQTEFA